MTQRTMHAELNSKEFPYNFRELSSTVVFNQGSEIQRGVPGGFSGAEAEKNFGVCQAYYLDNVMPISRGYSSVAFNSVVPPIGDISSIIAAFDIIGAGDQIALFVATQTSAYVYDPNGGEWQQLNIGATSPELVSYALVKEVTYIYYGYNIYIYNFESQQLESQTLLGIADLSAIKGIAAAGAQMIAWDDSSIYTSSVLNPLDFNIVDGLSTGAGATGVLALKGIIVACLSLGQDFIIYTNKNAVSARQTGSLQFPFVYKEIRGSAGISTIDHVAYNSNNESHVAWTPSGFQEINLESATYIWPELSDGITRGLRVTVDLDFALPELVRCAQLDVKINFLSNRWIVVSTRDATLASEGYYTDGYVFDTLLNRWGKLTVPHVTVIQFGLPEVFNQYTYDQFGLDYQLYDDIPPELVYAQLINNNEISTSEAGNNLGILLATGAVYTVSWSETAEFRGLTEVIGAARSRILFGKYKAFRTRGMTHQSLKVNKLHGANIKLYGHDYTGRYVDIKEDLVQNSQHTGQWFGRLNADSISIGFDGEFIISDLSFVSSDAGTINQKYQQLTTLLVATTDEYPLEEPAPDCCAFTGPRMIYEIDFVGQQSTVRVDLDCQECNELVFWTLTPRGASGADFRAANFPISGDGTTGSNNNMMYLGSVTLNPEHRPSAPGGVAIPMYNGRFASYDRRNLMGQLLIGTNGEVRFNGVDNNSFGVGIMGTPDLSGSNAEMNPDGSISSSGIWRRTVA